VLEYFKNAGEQRLANFALTSLARYAMFRNEPQLSRDLFSQALVVARSQGDEDSVSTIVNNLAEAEFLTGNVKRAIELGREAIARDRTGNPLSLTFGLANVSAYLISIDETEEAHPLAIEALRKSTDLQVPRIIAYAIQHLAAIAAARGDYERAATLLGFTDASLERFASPREHTEQQEYDAIRKHLNQALGDTRVSELLQRGASLTEEQATIDALQI
jgi:tetratricopeptide (TPR) repeat protein